MTILIILAKLGVAASYLTMLLMIRQFKQQDRHVKVEFDLLSRLEICIGIGLGLVSLVAVINPSTYGFTLGLCLLSIAVAQFQRYRMILAGDRYVLFMGKAHPYKEITGLGTGMFTLKVQTKDKPSGHSIYVPLTSNHVLKDKVQAKVKKKK